jgi:hypothetical protein
VPTAGGDRSSNPHPASAFSTAPTASVSFENIIAKSGSMEKKEGWKRSKVFGPEVTGQEIEDEEIIWNGLGSQG